MLSVWYIVLQSIKYTVLLVLSGGIAVLAAAGKVVLTQ